MKYEISKELFEAVIGVEIDIFELTNHYIQYAKNNDFYEEISYNDFFFKCKEWAYNQVVGKGFRNINVVVVRRYHYHGDYYIAKFDNNQDLNCSLKHYDIYHREANKVNELMFEADSEQQAVFNAATWILDNKNKQ